MFVWVVVQQSLSHLCLFTSVSIKTTRVQCIRSRQQMSDKVSLSGISPGARNMGLAQGATYVLVTLMHNLQMTPSQSQEWLEWRYCKDRQTACFVDGMRKNGTACVVQNEVYYVSLSSYCTFHCGTWSEQRVCKYGELRMLAFRQMLLNKNVSHQQCIIQTIRHFKYVVHYV